MHRCIWLLCILIGWFSVAVDAQSRSVYRLNHYDDPYIEPFRPNRAIQCPGINPSSGLPFPANRILLYSRSTGKAFVYDAASQINNFNLASLSINEEIIFTRTTTEGDGFDGYLNGTSDGNFHISRFGYRPSSSFFIL
jgi:hypothetical protein